MKHFLCLVFVLFSLALFPAVTFATPAEEAKYFYDVIVSGPTDKELSVDIRIIRYAYRSSMSQSGRPMDAKEKQYMFKELLTNGLQGDIHALAMASVLPHVDPEFSEGHDVSPIEPWLIRHLGEAEGHWLLGVFYLHWLSGSPLSHAPVYMNAPDHFRKSALAGNRKSMLFTSDYAPKGDDFTPPPGQELEHPMPDYIAKGDRENWYWKVRAAELGDAWANAFVGSEYAHVQPGWPVEETSRMVLYYWDRASRFGYSNAAAWLSLIMENGENTDSGTQIVAERDCKKAFFYVALMARMETDGEYLIDKKKSEAGAAAEFHAQNYLKGIPKINFAPCMTQSQYEAALKESKIAYDEFKARQAEEKAAQQALYDKARKALPELRAELAAVGVKIGEGQ